MKSIIHSSRSSRIATLLSLSACAANADITGPYSADANTIHLFHFDEAVNSTIAANAVIAGLNAIAFDGNPAANNAINPQPTNSTILGASAFAGFGNSANISAVDLGLGLDANNSGGFQMGLDAAASPDAILHSSLAGADGSFTMEAMINLPTGLGTGSYEIFCTDNSLTNTARGFQFRLNGTAPQSLEFNFIGTNTTTTKVSLPTTGDHALAAGQWFHVALAYDGPTHTSRFYWTKVDPATNAANLIGTSTVETTSGTISAPLVIGNEARSSGSGLHSTEGIRGLMDEVRISRIARSASDFIFFADTDNDDLADAWEVLHFIEAGEDPVADLTTILARQNGTANPDGDAYDNEVEETAGSDPNLAASTPLDIDADSLPDIWEITEFGNLNQTATGDPDNDYNNNAAEYAAGSDPESDLSWPDTDGGNGDGLNDGWEVHFFNNITAYADLDDPDNDGFSNTEEQSAKTNPTVKFSSPDTDADGLADGWEVNFFIAGAETPSNDLATIIARQDGTGDPDSDGSNNESEETGNSNPTLNTIRPYDLDGDNLADAWELQHFSSTTSQTGAGNADGDTFTNTQEQTAGSNPTLTASTPDDTDGDGTPNSAETLVPYAADADTLHLWDLDGSAAPVADRVYGPSNLPLEGLGNGATLGTTSVSGFGSALNTNLGYNTATGAYLAAKPAALGTADTVTSTWAGADGAFTFEALVRFDFDPLAVLTGNPPRMQIMAGDEDFGVETNRIFQFAIAPLGAQGNTGTTPRISFINIDSDPAIAGEQPQTLEVQLPDTGTHAPVQGQWFHVAVSYDGIAATASNLKFYWTRLESGATAANLAGAAQMSADLRATATDFAIGNETRDAQTGAFQGLIDQVRVSSIARTDTAFMFGGADPDSDADHLPDAWETTHFGNLDQTATGDFENDGTTNRAEYLLGLNPTDGSSFFNATVSGSTIQWQGVAGLNFIVQRSTTLIAASWSDISAQVGVDGLNSHTDPSPPAGKAFYRVLLVMP